MSTPKKSTEMVMAMVSPIGVKRQAFKDKLVEKFKEYDYEVVVIRLSEVLEPKPCDGDDSFEGTYQKIYRYMSAGNNIRSQSKDLLAKFAVTQVIAKRQQKGIPKNPEMTVNRVVYLIDSIKHHAELELLREVYGDGFYLLGINSGVEDRKFNLLSKKGALSQVKARYQVQHLMDLDACDDVGHGQEVVEVYHKSDYFFGDVSNEQALNHSVSRFLKLVFNHPYITPTFAEYAMHMAYVASTKSADMSRQVGAVVTKESSILSFGANDVPKAGGGTYWPIIENNGAVSDISGGRDYTRGIEANRSEINQMVSLIQEGLNSRNCKLTTKEIEEILKPAGVLSLTEFGRMLHAEMDALLDCAKRGIPLEGSCMYVTTFPCHNCAKHIVGSGVKKVVYVEPYPKSKALGLHNDSIVNLENTNNCENKVIFQPFIGLGPRYYMALFSISLSRGATKHRKDTDKISTVKINKTGAEPRLKMFPYSYLGREEAILYEVRANLPTS